MPCKAVSSLRAGDSKSMGTERWNELADYACFCGHLLQHGKDFVEDEAEMERLKTRVIRGDFWDVAKNFLNVKSPDFEVSQFPWPKKQEKEAAEAVSRSDVESLAAAQQDAQFKVDLMSLSADSAACLHYKQATVSTAKATAAAQAAHARAEIVAGRKEIVEPFMQSTCHVIAVDSINSAVREWEEFLRLNPTLEGGQKVRVGVADLNKLGRVGDQDWDFHGCGLFLYLYPKP